VMGRLREAVRQSAVAAAEAKQHSRQVTASGFGQRRSSIPATAHDHRLSRVQLYFTSSPVSSGMGDLLRAGNGGILSRYVQCKQPPRPTQPQRDGK